MLWHVLISRAAHSHFSCGLTIASEKLSRMWICGFILPLSQNIKKICDYDILTSWIALKKAGAWEDRMFDLLQLLREKVEPAV